MITSVTDRLYLKIQSVLGIIASMLCISGFIVNFCIFINKVKDGCLKVQTLRRKA